MVFCMKEFIVKNKIYVLWLFCFTHFGYGQEYVYPVATLDDETIFIMHQKSSDCLELWSWNIKTQLAFKELSSLYIPAQVTLLPSKKAYSFLDRGSLRIKSFEKRSPKTIEINEPIQDLQTITWIDDQTFYCTARYKKMYKPFMYDIDQSQSLQALAPMNDSVHYLFPNKINDQLFCITLDQDQKYQLVQLSWNPQPLLQQNSENQPKVLATLSEINPSCFLHMVSATQGFLLTMQKSELYSFSCCEITIENDAATLRTLFTFSIPGHLILGNGSQRLYESLYPFLPRYTQDYIYFTHYNEHNRCFVYQYNRHDQTTQSIPLQDSLLRENQQVFSPLIHSQGVLVGYSCESSDYIFYDPIAVTHYQLPWTTV